MEKIFGIDLGTTYSCVAYITEYDRPAVLKNADGELTTPSVVFFESPTSVIVGNTAKESAKMNPLQVVSFVKNSIGKADAKWTINGQTYTPEAVSAEVLRKIVRDAEDTLRNENKLGKDEHVRKVVITCPAYFGLTEREATKKAGEIAGLEVLDIINEPTAAAISYGVTDSDAKKTVMVYDLGGGTFDITVIQLEPGTIRVVCTGGDHQLGGKLWDDAIIEQFTQDWCKANESQEDITADPETFADLRLIAERVKKGLSARDRIPVTVSHQGVSAKTALTRERFEELTSGLLDSTVMMLHGVLAEAAKKGVRLEDISEVLLVGGSSKMPQVMARLKAELPHTEIKMFDPEEAVAKGAALYAANREKFSNIILAIAEKMGVPVERAQEMVANAQETGKVEPSLSGALQTQLSQALRSAKRIINVTSRSFGITAQDENDRLMLFNLIRKNDQLPAHASETFYTVEANQQRVALNVFESLSSEAKVDPAMGKVVGSIDLHLPDQLPAGAPLTVTFALDPSGLLHLHAVENTKNQKCECDFDVKGSLSDDEVRAAKERLQNSVVE